MANVYGVGIREDGKYTVTVDGKHTKVYTLWKNMLARCYSKTMNKHRPTYVGCSVSGDFLYFQRFAAWYESQSLCSDVEYQLDKDLIFKGNTVYSEATCLLVPRKVNMFLCKSEAARGRYAIGVSWHEQYGKFASAVSDSKEKTVSYHNTEHEAFLAYKVAKEKIAKGLANKYSGKCDVRIIEALNNYQVDITDQEIYMDDELFFGPCSEKQRLVLLEDKVDVLLTGGGEQGASTLKQLSNCWDTL